MKRHIRYSAARRLVGLAAVIAGLYSLSSTVFTQTPVLVVGASGAISPIVSDLDKALEFYHGLLGLKTDAPSTASPTDTPPPPILKLEGTPTGRMRWSHVTFPGTAWWAEPLEFGDVDRTPKSLRIQDPGAVTLVLLVRNVNDLLARLKKAGTRVLTPGGAPVSTASGGVKSRAVLVAGPDGHLVELRQPDMLPPDDATGDVIGGWIRVTVGNTDETLRLYRDRLGFEPHVGPFTSDPTFGALTGLGKAQVKWTSMTVPGNARLTFEMIEVNGVERHPLTAHIYDPGASRLMFMVNDLNAAVAAFTSTGGAAVSTDGKPVSLGRGGAYIVVRDLNNFFVILQERIAR